MAFVGRLLFVSIFVLSAWQEFSEFGDDGGPAAKAIVPKFSVFSKHVTAHTGFQVPKFEIKLLVAGAIAVKGFGSLLFIFGSTIGAFLLILHQLIATPILYDFYNYDTEKKEFTELFIKFTQNLALLGALMFFIGMKSTTPRRFGNKKRHSKSKAA
uniref:HR-like lesion-inducer n=1 Tax=Tanacetum cinerariifolium TaxID=118510 RepID=A0A6L2MC30_TANCI|nr:HR-like lesion-inducer [Tanacetum cinerariifolium]